MLWARATTAALKGMGKRCTISITPLVRSRVLMQRSQTSARQAKSAAANSARSSKPPLTCKLTL